MPPALSRLLTPTEPMIVSFVDAEGVRWEAWEAHPTLRERRAREERRAATRAVPDRKCASRPSHRPLVGWCSGAPRGAVACG